MPWRLIILIVIFGVFLAFITFNLENQCDISFGFAKIPDVPVFVTIFASFAMGLICALPLVLHIKKRRLEKPDKNIKPKKDEVYPYNVPDNVEPDDKIKKDAADARKRFFSRKRKG